MGFVDNYLDTSNQEKNRGRIIRNGKRQLVWILKASTETGGNPGDGGNDQQYLA